MTARRLAAGFLVLVALAGPGWAQRAELITQTELRVCADPSNLPFSNQAGDGFENRIAALIGADLELPVSYLWFRGSGALCGIRWLRGLATWLSARLRVTP